VLTLSLAPVLTSPNQSWSARRPSPDGYDDSASRCPERDRGAPPRCRAQLFYGYRPRRRRRARTDVDGSAEAAKRAAQADRNDHKLKALAIKKNQIHVVGAPSLTLAAVPIFLDVEGMPDRDSYYLVGLRFESGGKQVERSFWADGLEDERVIWANCLRTLKTIGNPQIVAMARGDRGWLGRQLLVS